MYHEEAIREPPLAALVDGASHGICPACLSQLMARRREQLRTAGDRHRALLVERERLRVVLAALRVRTARAIECSRALGEQSAAGVGRARELRRCRRLREVPAR